MIWNDHFVWLHLPKCGGSFIESVFRRYFSDRRSIRQDVIDLSLDPDISWHDSIKTRERRDRGFRVGDRTVIVPIRRLPTWLISIYNYEYGRNPQFDHRPSRLLQGRFMNHRGCEVSADALINHYVPSELAESGRLRLVRLEYLEMDFRAIFGQFVNVSRVPSSEFSRKVNASTNHVPEPIRLKLLYDHDELYQLCPAWASIERLAYGHESRGSSEPRP